MSLLVCAPKYGGCGYIGNGHEWGNGDSEGNVIICPKCFDDHAFQLTDENFGELTSGLSDEAKKQARDRLDKEHADVHGSFLTFCVAKGFISKNRLTLEQQAELAK